MDGRHPLIEGGTDFDEYPTITFANTQDVHLVSLDPPMYIQEVEKLVVYGENFVDLPDIKVGAVTELVCSVQWCN